MAAMQHGLLTRAQDIFLDAQSKASNGTVSTAAAGLSYAAVSASYRRVAALLGPLHTPCTAGLRIGGFAQLHGFKRLPWPAEFP